MTKALKTWIVEFARWDDLFAFVCLIGALPALYLYFHLVATLLHPLALFPAVVVLGIGFLWLRWGHK